jgi:hypothetical protein
MILKLTLLVSAPPGVVTTTESVVAPLGTTAVMYVSLTTLNSWPCHPEARAFCGPKDLCTRRQRRKCRPL